MPLFMDRHDVPGATAEETAEAHVRDVAIAGDYDVEFLSYWMDPDHGSVFCLARAPEQDNLIAVHQDSHGMIPNEIIPVEEGNILQFLGKIHEPTDHTEITSPFRTILFTDLEGSTALTEELGIDAFLPLLQEHDVIVRRAIVSQRGREVKHTGDGILASFEEIDGALRCCLTIQQDFKERTTTDEAPELRVRIGVTAGEPVDHNDDLFGSSVNLAARLCDAAEAGTILVSDVVEELGSKKGFTFEEADAKSLKGFAEPVQVFELLQI